MKRPVRRRLKRIVQKEKDIHYSRRANAMLLLYEGYCKSEVARLLQAARTTLDDWIYRYQTYGEAGLIPEPPGAPATTVNEALCARLVELIGQCPSAYGYHRTRWSSEMLALQIEEDLRIAIHASTVRRLLPKLGIRWNRACPTLCLRDPKKPRKMRAIRRALKRAGAHTPVFYVDEADIDLNPRIGPAWMPRGQQTRIPTPGKNRKRYLAGALHAHTGKVIWVEGEKKNSFLFIRLLAALRRAYRQARRVLLILDNYVIHKSAITHCFLTHNPKFQLLFQPVYHPWVNRIERVWKQLHDSVTRNHRCATMNQLMHAVRFFMHNVSPFPGSNVSLLKS
ncbi:MAG: IS630 family transposase [Gammaproteobacteria bacterium]